MNYSRLMACLLVSAVAVGCSADKDESAGQATSASGDMAVAAHDGGIPLSATDDTVMAKYMQVRDLADRGDFIEANQAARQLTEEYPDFAGGWIMLGNTALSGEQFVKATRKAVELAANGTAGEKLWADINMSFVTNDAEAGLMLGKKLVEAFPESPRAWIVYSGLLTGQNRHDEARAAGEEAVKRAPESTAAHNTLGFSYLNNSPKDFEKAERYFNTSIDLRPEEDNYWINVGDVHRAMGDLDSARSDYTKALALDPDNDIAAIKRAHVNSFLGDYEDARADYDMGIAAGREVTKSTLANYRAFVNLHAGDHEAAVAELKAELDRLETLEMPADQKIGARNFILTNIADICFNYGMLDDAAAAVDQLTASLAESGSNSGNQDFARQQEATATFWQAKLAARQGDHEAAAARAEEYRSLLADDANPRNMERYHEVHGLSALLQGNYAKAIEHYEQANLSTSPGGGDVKNIYMMAKALKGAGRDAEADELMQQVANWNFNSAWFAMLRNEASGTS